MEILDSLGLLADISGGTKTAVVIRGIVVVVVLISSFGLVRRLWGWIRRKRSGEGGDHGIRS